MKEINWGKISQDKKVIELLKERRKIEIEIAKIDHNALINYEIEMLAIDE